MSKTSTHSLRGKKILITAGPTWEMIDPVRFLSNRSSGLMGFEIAKAAARAGAKVTLVTGPTTIRYPVPNGGAVPLGTGYLTVVRVVSALEMYRECLKRFPKMDIAIMTAAVSDYRPVKIEKHKLKKKMDAKSRPSMTMTLKLVCNPDILATLGRRRSEKQYLVGFALESRRLLAYANTKLRRKGCDMIVANAVPALGASHNTATFLFRDGHIVSLPSMTKIQLAKKIIQTIAKGSHNAIIP